MNNHYKLKLFLMALSDPLVWVVDKSARSILDLGCGQGKPMAMIKLRRKIELAVGVDLYRPYIKIAKEQKIHDRYIVKDIRKVNHPPKSFDVVLANQVIEHLSKKDALSLIKKMEKIAKKQVIISTPIGEIDHPDARENKYQEHKSHFLPEELEKMGYKTLRYGWRWLLPPTGLAGSTDSPLLQKIYYLINFLVTPIYYIWQEGCDYSFTAHKEF